MMYCQVLFTGQHNNNISVRAI